MSIPLQPGWRSALILPLALLAGCATSSPGYSSAPSPSYGGSNYGGTPANCYDCGTVTRIEQVAAGSPDDIAVICTTSGTTSKPKLGELSHANLLAMAALYLFGSGPVKGFAVTVALGTVVHLFTATTLVRLMISYWFRSRRPRSLPV